MTVADLRGWIAISRQGLIASLLDASYRPQPVKEVEIPKPRVRLPEPSDPWAERPLRYWPSHMRAPRKAAQLPVETNASLSFQRDRSAFDHDIADPLHRSGIDQRVSLNCNQIRGLAGFECSGLG